MDKATAMAEIKWWLKILTEARAIVREEQAASEANPRSRRNEDEQNQVRAEVSYLKDAAFAIDIVMGWEGISSNLAFQRQDIADRLRSLLSRERELTAKSEPEGGDRG